MAGRESVRKGGAACRLSSLISKLAEPMPPAPKALVAVNDTEAALNAFTEALRWSLRTGLKVAAVCVQPPYRGGLEPAGMHRPGEALGQPCREVLEEAVKMAVEAGAGLVTFKAVGERHEAVIELAVREGCRLIIIGQGPGPWWLSPTGLTAGLLRFSPVDLLVVPRGAPIQAGRILYSRLGRVPQEPDAPAARRAAERLFGSFVGELVGGDGCDIRVAPPSAARIRRAAAKETTDLIVLDSGSAPVPWSLGRAIRFLRIARHAACPVWTIKGSA